MAVAEGRSRHGLPARAVKSRASGDDVSDEQWHRNFQRKYPNGVQDFLARRR